MQGGPVDRTPSNGALGYPDRCPSVRWFPWGSTTRTPARGIAHSEPEIAQCVLGCGQGYVDLAWAEGDGLPHREAEGGVQRESREPGDSGKRASWCPAS